MIDEAVLRGAAGIDEGFEPSLEASRHETPRSLEIGPEHPPPIRLGRIGAVGREMEHPVRLDGADRRGDRVVQGKVDFMAGCVNVFETPSSAAGAYKEVHVVAVREEPPGKNRSHEASSSGDDHSFRHD